MVISYVISNDREKTSTISKAAMQVAEDFWLSFEMTQTTQFTN